MSKVVTSTLACGAACFALGFGLGHTVEGASVPAQPEPSPAAQPESGATAAAERVALLRGRLANPERIDHDYFADDHGPNVYVEGFNVCWFAHCACEVLLQRDDADRFLEPLTREEVIESVERFHDFVFDYALHTLANRPGDGEEAQREVAAFARTAMDAFARDPRRWLTAHQ